MNERALLQRAQRVVVKVGTRVLTRPPGGLVLSRLYEIVEQLAELHRDGREVLLVSSGAVGLGRESLGLDDEPMDLGLRQACAAVGQSRLMELYQHGFARLGIRVAQLLLTRQDFERPEEIHNVEGVLRQLLERRVLPIVNENDVVATEELALRETVDGQRTFGDNDQLSALVATRLYCHLLVLCTDVDGVFDADPRAAPEAELIGTMSAERTGDGAGAPQLGGPTPSGRGGMRSKVEAARLVARAGCHGLIVNGREPGRIVEGARGGRVGTWFPAEGRHE
ncbi:MAG: glutamate 5-kinase [Myxococcota bacterium]